jgi:predicted RNase H-like nuclease (RuvC/YqgF family)
VKTRFRSEAEEADAERDRGIEELRGKLADAAKSIDNLSAGVNEAVRIRRAEEMSVPIPVSLNKGESRAFERTIALITVVTGSLIAATDSGLFTATPERAYEGGECPVLLMAPEGVNFNIFYPA